MLGMPIQEPLFILDRDGNQVAAIVDIDSYRALLQTLEDIADIADARQAMIDDPVGLPLDEAIRDIERMAAEYEAAGE